VGVVARFPIIFEKSKMCRNINKFFAKVKYELGACGKTAALQLAGQCAQAGQHSRARRHSVSGRVLQDKPLGELNATPRQSEGFMTLEEARRQHILQALEKTSGVLAGPKGAAQLLGVNRSTLWLRMRKLGINLPKQG
jgi:transcriptional regulator with GAF, ATPase, and Fis domain